MLALTVKDHWSDGKKIHVLGTVQASGTYVTGGDIISLKDTEIKSNSIPEFTLFQGAAGYSFRYIQGTTRANGKLKVFLAGTEIAQAAYPVAISGDVINFYGIFRLFI